MISSNYSVKTIGENIRGMPGFFHPSWVSNTTSAHPVILRLRLGGRCPGTDQGCGRGFTFKTSSCFFFSAFCQRLRAAHTSRYHIYFVFFRSFANGNPVSPSSLFSTSPLPCNGAIFNVSISTSRFSTPPLECVNIVSILTSTKFSSPVLTSPYLTSVISALLFSKPL